MNISQSFIDFTHAHPEKTAFVIPRDHGEDIITYQDFYQLVSRYRQGLINSGHKRGDRIILLMPIDLEFYALMMAMMSLGLVMVFLDPGIGVKKLLIAINDSKAQTVISIKRFLKLRFFLPMLWGKKLYSKDSHGLGLISLSTLKGDELIPFSAVELGPHDHFLITFTSGSTGRSKGSDRCVSNVFNQVQVIKNLWPSDCEQVDFSSFLMLGFMNLCFGITTVIPPMSFSNISGLDAEAAVELIRKYQVTRLSGSSAFLAKIARYLVSRNESITSILNTAQGGSPVSDEFCADMEQAFPKAQNHIVYGSTEVAPISVALMSEVRRAKKEGALVGRPVSGLEVLIVELPPISSFDERGATPYTKAVGEWGEVIIKGPHVVAGYVDNPEAALTHKITTLEGEVWHRSGDVGHFDQAGQLWITGRLSELVKIGGRIYRPYLIEAAINEVPGIKRSALINTKKGARLVLELSGKLAEENLKNILEENSLSQIKIAYVEKMPVDVRHHSKIDRTKLAKQLR